MLVAVVGMNAQVNTDSIFDVAIKQSHNKEYHKAIRNAKTVLAIHPERADVTVFLANVYAFNQQSDSAGVYLVKAFELDPHSTELYDSWLNILWWNNDNEQLLMIADSAEKYEYKNTYNLLLKRIIAYKNIGRHENVVILMEGEKNKKYLDSAIVKDIYRESVLMNNKNVLSAYYTIDLYENNTPEPQHLMFVDYAFKIKRHTAILRAKYANTYYRSGFQIEADYYHHFKNGHYTYWNYGKSVGGDVFPRHRAGFEYYWPLKKQINVSLGGRYMNYSDEHIFILTGHVGKYLNNYWFALRPFYSIKDVGQSFNAVGNIRRYESNQINYWGLKFGYGNSPDSRFLISQTGDFFRLQSYRIKLERKQAIGIRNSVKFSVGYAYEEFIDKSYRNRFNFEIIFKHRL